MNDSSIGNKQGLRWKRFGSDWSPAQHKIELTDRADYDACKMHSEGYALQREQFPEALAVWDRTCFSGLGDLFTAGGFYAVQGKLAAVLAQFNLGEGGLIPFPIYKEDLRTPEEGDFLLLNFGARKKTFIADQSKSIRKMFIEKKSKLPVWDVGFGVKDDDIALSADALQGADLWMEERVFHQIFMSDALVSAIHDAGVGTDFRLSQCRVIEP